MEQRVGDQHQSILGIFPVQVILVVVVLLLLYRNFTVPTVCVALYKMEAGSTVIILINTGGSPSHYGLQSKRVCQAFWR